MIIPNISVKSILTVCLLLLVNSSYGVVIDQEPQENVKIGLLITDAQSVAARDAATLAIKKANSGGGYRGRPFELLVRSMEGPWGTGSKQAVSLIFDENVCAIIGSHDGRNAHLVEQVAAKERFVFLSAWADDPTLSQAFVPWFFNCVPNDNQQSHRLAGEIFVKRKIRKAAFISDNSYDSKMALNSFLREIKSTGNSEPIQLFYDNQTRDFSSIIQAIIRQKAECVVLSGQPHSQVKIIQLIHKNNIPIPLFCTLSLLDDKEFSEDDLKICESSIIVSSGHWLGKTGSDFRNEFVKTFGYEPGAVAAYAYDAANMLIEAIRKGGLERENIRKSLSEIKHDGVTGQISFDEKGNRKGEVLLMEIKSGIQVPVR